jgi:hypothetical protein
MAQHIVALAFFSRFELAAPRKEPFGVSHDDMLAQKAGER